MNDLVYTESREYKNLHPKRIQNLVEKQMTNIAAIKKSGQKQIVSEINSNFVASSVLCSETRPNSLGCVFFLNEGRQKR